MEHTALIAMSGGVDSSVAAYLTGQEGYRCIGATMRLCQKDDRCGGTDDVEDARKVAQRLGMDFYALDAFHIFRQQVMDPFVSAYESGLTPNPCIECNRKLKFGFLLDKAAELGCDHIVTGHYARIYQDPNSGRYLLRKAADHSKDQTYFLAGLTQRQLQRILFPLGHLTKEQVRAIALEQGFINARKRDSQDICFVPDGDYVAFMKAHTGKTYCRGDFLDLQGNVVGKHQGAVAYTLGQRKGLGLAMGHPVYVCDKDMNANTVTVGPDSALFTTTLYADQWNWLAFPQLEEPIRVLAKVRYRHAEQPATVYPLPDGVCKVVFDEPQRAITPGQAVVLYQQDLVIGAGTIIKEQQ